MLSGLFRRQPARAILRHRSPWAGIRSSACMAAAVIMSLIAPRQIITAGIPQTFLIFGIAYLILVVAFSANPAG